MDAKNCINPSCNSYGQTAFLTTSGGDSFCSECGWKIASDSKLVSDLEFNKISKPNGRFIINDFLNGKFCLNFPSKCRVLTHLIFTLIAVGNQYNSREVRLMKSLERV